MPAPELPTEHLRAGAGFGVGDSGIATGVQLGAEHYLGAGHAVGVTGGAERSATLFARSNTTLGYGAALWRVGTLGTDSASDSQLGRHYSFALTAGAGVAKRSFPAAGDCGFLPLDDGIGEECVIHSRSSWGALVGGGGSALYSFGWLDIGIDLSGHVLIGSINAGNLTLGPVVSVGF